MKNLIHWFFSITFIAAGIASLFKVNILSGVFLILAGIVINPIFINRVKRRTEINAKDNGLAVKVIPNALYWVASLIFMMIGAKSDPDFGKKKEIAVKTENIIQKEAEIPADLSYDIIEEVPNGTIKSNLRIRIGRKASIEELTAIANKLRNERTQYDRLWIFYLLPNMNNPTDVWAISHFTPKLDVEILGTTNEEAKKMNELTENIDGGKIISKWVEETKVRVNLVYYEKNGKFFMKVIYKDGSSSSEEVIGKQQNQSLRLNIPANSHGEYYVINKKKELDFYNKENTKFATAKIIK